VDQLKTKVTFDPFTLDDSGNDCATLDGFSNALHKILNAAWGNNWGIYSEEEPTGNDPETQPAPHITFELRERKRAEQFKSFRSHVMHVMDDPDNPGFHLTIKQRIFKCNVAWKCYHKTNRASRVMAGKLEYFLENYVGYFKEHGLLQLEFEKEEKPKIEKSSRQKLCETTLIYNAYVVETMVERTRTLHELQILAEVINPTNIIES